VVIVLVPSLMFVASVLMTGGGWPALTTVYRDGAAGGYRRGVSVPSEVLAQSRSVAERAASRVVGPDDAQKIAPAITRDVLDGLKLSTALPLDVATEGVVAMSTAPAGGHAPVHVFGA
jgi:hypothetical protein